MGGLDVSIDPVLPGVNSALDWLQFGSIVLLGIVSYFLKRCLVTIDKLEAEVQALKIKIAIVVDRDRRQRLADYLAEARGNLGDGIE
jgi:hypothetical protein